MSEDNNNGVGGASTAPQVAAYNGVPIYYCVQNGRLVFEFEGEREVNYLFEAKQIIDEPRWEACDLEGYYLDHSLDYHIGLAKATRRDIKSGRPDWKYKGKYDMGYKRSQGFRDDTTKVYPLNIDTHRIYQDWQKLRDEAQLKQRQADLAAQRLTKVEAL